MQQGNSLASKSLGRFPIDFCSKHIQWGLQSQQYAICKAWLEPPMNAEWHQQGRSGDFIAELKNMCFLLFCVWINEFRMRDYFLKTCFLNR